jgi:glycosyltransferase involved in cell wall biosynthesis
VEPLVSVVIPTYNRAKEIGPSLESIQAQTYPHWEVFVVDDGSNDNTAEVVKQFTAKDSRIHFIQHEHNRGAQAARNTGIKTAKGEWIAFLDSDDRWLPKSLALRLAVAERENVLVVHSAGYLQKEGAYCTQYYIPAWSGLIYHKVLTREGPMFQALLVKKEALEKIGYLDENIRAFQEWDTSIRLAKYFEFGFEPQPTFVYDLRSSDAISRDLVRGGVGYEQNIFKHRWAIVFNVGVGSLATHYEIASLWYRNGNDHRNARRCAMLAIMYKCLSISCMAGKIRHLNARAIVKIKTVKERMASIWSVVKLLPWYLIDNFRQSKRTLPENDKKILFTFDDPNMFGKTHNDGREAYNIIKSFSDKGYNVYLQRQTDFKSYYRLREFGRLIYGIKNFKFITQLPSDSKNYIYGFDTIRYDNLRSSWKKLVYVNIRKASTYQIGNVIPMPFFPIPFITASGEGDHFAGYRNLARKYKIIFGGNLNPVYYDSPLFRQRWPNYMTRLEALSSVLESDVETLFIKDAKEFNKLISSPDRLNKFVIVQTDFPFPINPKQWPKIMGQSDFFMCFSGTDYPMCHNAIEAMAVGTIPILAYADWFDPKLEHGKNAIVYSGKEDMIEKIKLALQMSEEDIQKLRTGAIEYYKTYLSKGAVATKYEKDSQYISTLILFPLLRANEAEVNAGQVFVRNFQNIVGINNQQESGLRASVIIPTAGNRRTYLKDTLLAAQTQEFNTSEYEILVVDNSNGEQVKEIVNKVNNNGKKIVFYIKEENKGLHYSRHAGARDAKGGVLVYIDDDIILPVHWLEAILSPFKDPKVGCVGGKVLPQWEAEAPLWMSQFEPAYLSLLDYGEKPLELKDPAIWGCNMAVRKNIFFEVGGSNVDFFSDPKLMIFAGDGECGLEEKIYTAGYKLIYEPRAWIYHRIPASRLTPEYYYDRFIFTGIHESYTRIRRWRTQHLFFLRIILFACIDFVKACFKYVELLFGKVRNVRSRAEYYRYRSRARHGILTVFSNKLREHVLRKYYL